MKEDLAGRGGAVLFRVRRVHQHTQLVIHRDASPGRLGKVQ